MKTKLVNYNIEIIRIIALFSVIYLHMLGNGNVIRSLTYMTPNYLITWTIECISFCAINYFALISGFLTYKKKFLINSLLYNWLTTIFYAVGITSIILILNNSFSFDSLQSFFTPFLSKYNWYFVSYFILSLIQPFIYLYHKYINKYIDTICIIILLILTSILPVFYIDPLKSNLGYSTIWLLCVYLIGAYLRKYNPLNRVNNKLLYLVIIFCIGSMMASKLYIGYKTQPLDINYTFNQLISYNSPLVLLCSISVFTIIMRAQITLTKKSEKIISFFSNSAFSMYIIQVHPLLWDYYKNKLVFLADSNIIFFILFIILVPIICATLLASIDYIKRLIFKSLKIDYICKYIGNLFTN